MTGASARIVIVGGGPAGLRAAADLAPRVDGDVIVLEREAVAGGIPRHCDHLGYGLRDLGTFTSGPKYARLMADRAAAAGAIIRTSTMVTGWSGDRAVEITSPEGRSTISADVVILATGARERPRSARLIPGARSAGVFTTGQLQNHVYLKEQPIGERAVILGTELVSWSATMTLRHAGCATALMVTEQPRAESYAVFNALGRDLARIPVATQARITRIIGDARVTGVEVENLRTGQRRTIACDTVVVTGDWIPDNELARATGIALDPASRAPLVDSALRTDRDGVFAIGNVLHPVDTADVAALDGAAVVPHVLDYLAGAGRSPEHIELAVTPPLRWISPGRIDMAHPQPPRGRLLMWTDELRMLPRITATQDGTVIARRRVAWPAAPGRVFRVPSSILDKADPRGGPVTISLS